MRLSNSSVSMRSEFHTSERSVVRMSVEPCQTSAMSLRPSSSTSPVRKTAQFDCMTFCMRERSSAVAVEPEA